MNYDGMPVFRINGTQVFEEVLMEKVLGNKKVVFAFIFPAAFIFSVFVLIPILMSVGFSLTNWQYGEPEISFIGLKNYGTIFTQNDGLFLKAVGNSLKYMFASVFIMVPLAFILASLLATGQKGGKIFMTILFLPVVISGTIVGQMWIKLYNYDYGVFNLLLRASGLGRFADDWLGNPQTAIWAVIITCIWQGMPYTLLMFYAAVKGIPEEILESAALDGAVGIKRMRYIILPSCRAILEVCLTFAVINSFKIYDIIVSMTNGGPMNATEVPSTQMITVLFRGYDYGRGSAMAVFIVLECLVCTLVIRKAMKERK